MRLLTDIRLISCSACDSERGCLTDSIVGGDAYAKRKPASSPADGGGWFVLLQQSDKVNKKEGIMKVMVRTIMKAVPGKMSTRWP